MPIVEILRQAARVSEGDSAEDLRDELGRQLPEDEDRDAVADRLARLVSTAGSVPHQEEIFWAVTRFLESQAADRPLVVIFEDIHWAEPTLLDLLDHLHLRSQDVAMMIVAFARPELRELRPHLVRTDSSIALRSLNEDATRALIESNLGGSELPEEVVSRIDGDLRRQSPLRRRDAADAP